MEGLATQALRATEARRARQRERYVLSARENSRRVVQGAVYQMEEEFEELGRPMRRTTVVQAWSVGSSNALELVDALEFSARNVADSDEIEWFVDEGREG